MVSVLPAVSPQSCNFGCQIFFFESTVLKSNSIAETNDDDFHTAVMRLKLTGVWSAGWIAGTP